MNKLIIEFNNFVNNDNQSLYNITYENPIFLIDSDGGEDMMYNIPNYKLNNIMNNLISDFNESNLVRYMNNKQIKFIDRIKSIIANDYNINNNSFYIDVSIIGEPSKEEIDIIMNYIEGQCSDGWGEAFEQTPVDGYFISTFQFKQERKIKHIKIKKVV